MNRIFNTYFFILLILIMGCSSDSEKNELDKQSADKNNSSNHEWTNENTSEAFDNCVDSENSERFCECSTSILTSLFTYQEFKTFDSQIKSGINPPPAIVSKMIEMGQRTSKDCQRGRW